MDPEIKLVSTEGDEITFKESFKDFAKAVYDAIEDGDEKTLTGFAISTATLNLIKDYLESCNYEPKDDYAWYKRGTPKPTNTNNDLNETDKAFCEKCKFR